MDSTDHGRTGQRVTGRIAAAVIAGTLGLLGVQEARGAIVPSISDLTPEVGQTLTATTSHDGNLHWAWVRCADETKQSCSEVAQATSDTYAVADADLGQRLRVRLRVTGAAGPPVEELSDPTAPVTLPTPPPEPTPDPTGEPTPDPTSEPTPDPTPDPTPEPTPEPTPQTNPESASLGGAWPSGDVAGEANELSLMDPFPVVRIRGWTTRRGARITLLSVRAPRGARITARCWGRDCPRRRLARTAGVRRLRSFERRLRAGVVLEVRVTQRRRIGKYTRFVIRRAAPPARVDRCLIPGSKRPRRCPGG